MLTYLLADDFFVVCGAGSLVRCYSNASRFKAIGAVPSDLDNPRHSPAPAELQRPLSRHAVLANHLVRRHQDKSFDDRLRNEDAIERVTMKRR
jgi:hypothetical protein